MARKTHAYSLDTRSARSKLARINPNGERSADSENQKPFYRPLDGTLIALGYTKPTTPKNPGRWSAKKSLGGNRITTRALGLADDLADADGKDVLSFAQALAAARVAFDAVAAPVGAVTVGQAFQEHADHFASNPKKKRKLEQRFAFHTTPEFRALALASLTETQMSTLRNERTARNIAKNRAIAERAGEEVDEHELARRAKSSINRAFKDINAALTRGARVHKTTNKDSWKIGAKAARGDRRARSQHFDEVQIGALVRAIYNVPLARLVVAGWLTGARLGELTAIRVRDLNVQNNQVYIRRSKTANSNGIRWITLPVNAIKEFAKYAAGRAPNELLLANPEGKEWTDGQFRKEFKAALATAGLDTEAVFTTLRHSYISRAIENKDDLVALSRHCGTSVSEIEKTYAHTLARVRYEFLNRFAPAVPAINVPALKIAA